MHIRFDAIAGAGLLAIAAACSPSEPKTTEAAPVRVAGSVYTVKDTTVQTAFEADGVAQPLRQATLSTKLMGTILSVLVQEGDAVAAGQPLVRIDARDLSARQAQVAASIADAEAARRDAATQAGRIRALYADSAATRAQLDAVETGLARAEAGVHAARASAAEVSAMSAYAVVRAPFAAVVTRRFVDPGAFAAPGAPLVTVQDGTQLRIAASATPEIARALRRGETVRATIEGTTVQARIEGVVPAAAGNLYTINALVANPGGTILPGSTAALLLPQGEQVVRVVPVRAVLRSGDLTGVTVRAAEGDVTRWVRLGRTMGSVVEVTGGLRAGDRVVVPVGGAPPSAGGY
ncbi:MAG: efflux RND transporter periplasmic adaptor subunit [Gemmatimonadaceae bacterium]|nr:efflux RND transporter periplasmic adaptor subunit [Gemmatimonadaceae bacterium]